MTEDRSEAVTVDGAGAPTAREVWERAGRPGWVTESMLDGMTGQQLQASIDFPRQQLAAYREVVSGRQLD